MKAWLFQDTRQKQKLGDKCPWSVGGFDADGKKRSKKIGPRSYAEKFRKQNEAQLLLRLTTPQARKKWSEFRTQFFATALAGKASGTVEQYVIAFDNFERIIKPVYLDSVTTAAIDAFKAARSKEKGRPRIPKAVAAGASRKQKQRKPLKPTVQFRQRLSTKTCGTFVLHFGRRRNGRCW